MPDKKKRPRHQRRPLAEVEQYGFKWGPIDVVRAMKIKGKVSLSVISDYHDLEIGVSETGRSVRVWLDGKELK